MCVCVCVCGENSCICVYVHICVYIYLYIHILYINIYVFCMQYSTYKRLIRKGEQDPTPGPQSHHVNCDMCGKLCLSLAGLKSHRRKCAKSILHPNNVTANKTDRLCQFGGKICHSLAVMKSHIRTHTI